MMNDRCSIHGKERDLFCQQCNTCFCNICYEADHQKSGCVGQRVLTVKGEVARRKTEEIPILQKEVKEFAECVKRSNAKVVGNRTELTAKCHFEIGQIWRQYEAKVESARLEAIKLCETVIRKNHEEETQMRHTVDANDRKLLQIEICLSHYQRLLTGNDRKTDILHSLNRLESKVRDWQEELNRSKITHD